MGTGISGMGELIIVTLLAGGMLELIRFNGGVDYILQTLTRRINGKRGAEFCIAALVSIAIREKQRQPFGAVFARNYLSKLGLIK